MNIVGDSALSCGGNSVLGVSFRRGDFVRGDFVRSPRTDRRHCGYVTGVLMVRLMIGPARGRLCSSRTKSTT